MLQTFNVLVAEDDPNDALLLERAIRKTEVPTPIQFVRDGEEAIAYLQGTGRYCDRTCFPLPKLIILDLKMPRKMGFDVLAWIRNDPDLWVIPTLVLSSSAQPEDVRQSYRFGANTFFAKPSRFHDLERMIRIIQEYWTMAEMAHATERR
jgi:CheY-like chemotaxis protein